MDTAKRETKYKMAHVVMPVTNDSLIPLYTHTRTAKESEKETGHAHIEKKKRQTQVITHKKERKGD